MRWLEVSTHVDNEAVEAVSETFQRFVHGGVVIEYETEPGPEIAWNEGTVLSDARPITIRGYLPRTREGHRRRRRLEEALWHLNAIWPIPPPSTRVVDEEDWANAWKGHFFAHRVGERLVIRPSWREFGASPDDLVVTLDPGMAFGTGLHPTTRLCLLLLEQTMRGGERVLDLGTGSGILAIASARLGAASVLALDLDDVAVAAARGNVAANGLEDIVSVRPGSIDAAAGQFDLVVANIIARVIADLAPDLAAVVRPGGTLIASGILDTRADEVAAALRTVGCDVIAVSEEADWRALRCQRTP